MPFWEFLALWERQNMVHGPYWDSRDTWKSKNTPKTMDQVFSSSRFTLKSWFESYTWQCNVIVTKFSNLFTWGISLFFSSCALSFLLPKFSPHDRKDFEISLFIMRGPFFECSVVKCFSCLCLRCLQLENKPPWFSGCIYNKMECCEKAHPAISTCFEC